MLTTELEQMLEVMMQHDVTEVCMESTCVYWMPIWRMLENYIPKLMLVNPYFIKQLSGNKCDVKDAEWIATCLLKDLIRVSYVPEDRIPQLRQYDRRIIDLNKGMACFPTFPSFFNNQERQRLYSIHTTDIYHIPTSHLRLNTQEKIPTVETIGIFNVYVLYYLTIT